MLGCSKKTAHNGQEPGPPAHDDLVQRHFVAAAPNTLWLTDITEHWTGEGKLYLSAIKDVYSGRIVGYSISDRMKSRLAVDALNSAVARRGGASEVAGCVVHSDRGSQFRSRRFLAELRHHDLVGSMGRSPQPVTTPPWSPSSPCCRRTSSTRRRWTTRQELRLAIITWIERTYHRRRRQARLGRLTPIEYETINAPQVALAP